MSQNGIFNITTLDRNIELLVLTLSNSKIYIVPTLSSNNTYIGTFKYLEFTTNQK